LTPAEHGAVVVLAVSARVATEVAGDLSAGGRLEHLARLWIDLSRDYGREIGFRLLCAADDG